MFDKLDDILMRLEEVLNQLSEPDVAADAAKFQKLMKEQDRKSTRLNSSHPSSSRMPSSA